MGLGLQNTAAENTPHGEAPSTDCGRAAGLVSRPIQGKGSTPVPGSRDPALSGPPSTHLLSPERHLRGEQHGSEQKGGADVPCLYSYLVDKWEKEKYNSSPHTYNNHINRKTVPNHTVTAVHILAPCRPGCFLRPWIWSLGPWQSKSKTDLAAVGR